MISFGQNIQSSTDTLKKVKVENVYHAIKRPKPETESMIRRLRIVRNIDAKQYACLKKQLPYLVCGMFNPPYRKKENFAYTQYFILDLDHLTMKGFDIGRLRSEIESDARVVMCFLSPSEDGLKVMFRLTERCYDANIFSLFYKLFCKQFSMKYHLEQVVDTVTSDVSRACFVSMDAEAYFNPDAQAVAINDYVDETDPLAFYDLKHQIEKETKQASKEGKNDSSATDTVDDDVIRNIKSLLNPNGRTKEKPMAYVPEELERIMDDLQQYIAGTGVAITDVISIQYGKKIRTAVGIKQAETNLFYGKRGFSVVISPRTGTNQELNEVVAQLIKNYFDL